MLLGPHNAEPDAGVSIVIIGFWGIVDSNLYL